MRLRTCELCVGPGFHPRCFNFQVDDATAEKLSMTVELGGYASATKGT